jgi:hypothetical protein
MDPDAEHRGIQSIKPGQFVSSENTENIEGREK